MLSPRTTCELLHREGLDFYTGVPDSLLKDFCAFISDHTKSTQHVLAANEGNAIALAAGHYLGSSTPAVVYMQNSGIGNAVNPLLSLADAEVYNIPMLLMIGWRGEPGVPDEPQHVKQGRVTPALLDAMEIPWFEISPETQHPEDILASACAALFERKAPTALLVRKGTFESYESSCTEASGSSAMSREDAIDAVVSAAPDNAPIISTTGKASRELFELRNRRSQPTGRDFLTVGSMGHASSIALGLSLAQPHRLIICLDGDGALLMHMGSLATIGSARPSKFLHVVINNGAHDSVGGQRTAGFDIDIPAIAQACGYSHASRVKDAAEIAREIKRSHNTEGPVLIEILARKGSRSDLGRPSSSPLRNREDFSDWLRRTD